MSNQKTPHNVLFSMPRTASQLLVRQLNLPHQPSILREPDGYDGYLFQPVVAQRFWNTFFGAVMEEWTDEHWDMYRSALQAAFDTWCNLLENANNEGKGTYIKEHLSWLVDSHCEAENLGYDMSKISRGRFKVSWLEEPAYAESKLNVTCLPDAFLQKCTKPTFMIRHPVYAFPSFVRVSVSAGLIKGLPATIQDANRTYNWECTYGWTLSLYRFYKQSSSFDRSSHLSNVQYPIIVDGADLSNEELVEKYAKAVGLDEDQVVFTWQATPEEDQQSMRKLLRHFSKSVLDSTGVETSKLGDAVVDWEGEKERFKDEWKEEFGELIAECLVRYVEESLPDYHALWKLRLQL